MQNRTSLFPQKPIKRSYQELPDDELFGWGKNRCKVLTEEYLDRVGRPHPSQSGDSRVYAEPENTVIITHTNFNFDKEKVLKAYHDNAIEKQAVDRNLANEKNLLREAFIHRARKAMAEAQNPYSFKHN